MTKIPDDFIWGAATAAFQVEGGLDDMVDYGLVANISESPFESKAGQACNSYELFEEDIALLAGFGFKSYRFSIEWARIEPEKGQFNLEAVDHYRRVISACRNLNIVPVVTLHHFTSPLWLISMGGWESNETPELFSRYTAFVMQHLGDALSGRSDGTQPGLICTLNEVNTGRLNEADKGPLDERRSSVWVKKAAQELDIDPEQFAIWSFASSYQAVRIILESHRAAVRTIKGLYPELKVGLTMASQNVEAQTPGNAEIESFKTYYWEFVEDCFLQELGPNIADSGDFIGVQSYTRTLIGLRTSQKPGVVKPAYGTRLTQMEYEFHPQSLGACLEHTYQVTKMPIIVTECGLGTDRDAERVEYYLISLDVLLKKLDEGLPILGWYAWSLLDNYEWEFGSTRHFGLIEVDSSSYARIPKPSAPWLGRKIQEISDLH